MHPGALLVLVGTILAFVAFLGSWPGATPDARAERRYAPYWPSLAIAGVILIGAGCLIGKTVIT